VGLTHAIPEGCKQCIEWFVFVATDWKRYTMETTFYLLSDLRFLWANLLGFSIYTMVEWGSILCE